MSAGLSASDGFLRLSEAARSAPDGAAPARELRQLLDGVHRWLSSSVRDDWCFGFLTGEPGYGQRELLETLDEVCGGSGIHRLRVRSHAETCVPGLIADIVHPLLHDGHLSTGAHDRRGVTVPRDVLLELLKVTAGPDEGESPGRLPCLSPSHDRLRLVDAVTRALLEVTARGPLVLILDHVDVADSSGHEVLRQLTRMLRARKAQGGLPRLLTIVSVRDEHEAALVFGSVRRAVAKLTAFEIDVRGYSLDDLRRLAGATFRDERVAPDERLVLSRTRGSVQHARWLYRLAREGVGTGDAASSLEHCGRLLDLSFWQIISRCFARLPEEKSRAVAALAILGRAVPEHVALEVASGKLGQTSPAVCELRDEGWAVVSPGAEAKARNVAIIDSQVAQAVLGLLSPMDRDSLRGRAAHALEREARRDPRWLPSALGHHAAVPEVWPEDSTLRAAACYLRLLSSPAMALRLLEEPLLRRLASRPEDQESWLRLYAELLQDAGETRRAIEAYREAREASGEPEVTARLSRAIGDLLEATSEREECHRAYEEGLEALAGDSGNVERLKLLCAIARTRLKESRRDEARTAVSRCLELIEGGAQRTRDECLEVSWLVREAFPEDSPRSRAIDDELDRCRPGADTLGQFRSLCRLARLHARHGRGEEEGACLAAALETARRSGSRALIAEAGWLSARTEDGGFKPLSRLRRYLDVFDDLGDRAGAQRVNVHLLYSELERGKFSRAGRRAQVVGERWTKAVPDEEEDPAVSWEERIDSYVPPLVVYARGALLGGDHHRAQETIEQALAELADAPHGDVVQVAHRTAAQVALAAGDLAHAYEHYLRGLRSALDVRSRDGTAEAFLGFSEFFLQGGAFATAIGLARGALALARGASKTRCELPLRRLLGRLAVVVGDRADEQFERAAALAASLDMPSETCQLNLERGWERYYREEYDDALCLAEQGIQITSQCGFRPLESEFHLLVGATRCAAAARASHGVEWLEKALAEARALGMPRLEWEVLQTIASLPDIESERAVDAASRAAELSLRVLGGLPRILQGITWHSRVAVVNHGKRRTNLSACAG